MHLFNITEPENNNTMYRVSRNVVAFFVLRISQLVRHLELKKYILRWCPVNSNEKTVQDFEDLVTFDQMMKKV